MHRAAAQALRSRRRDLQGQRLLPHGLPFGVVEVVLGYEQDVVQLYFQLQLQLDEREQEHVVGLQLFIFHQLHDKNGSGRVLTARLSTYPQLSTAA
jgi:hypothetical protein